jgi:hypothetical protein
MAGIGINIDNPLGFLSTAFVNDTAVAEAAAAGEADVAEINANAALQASMYAADKQTETITYILIAVTVIAFLFLILWYLKS